MNDTYQPSEAPKKATQDNSASRAKRFFAFAIDIVFLFFAMMFVVKYLGLEPTNATDLQAAQADMMAKIEALSPQQKMFLALSPYLAFFVLHGPSLFQTGQTLGKRMLGIAIVTLDGQKPSFLQLITQRYLPQWLFGMIPLLGPFLRLADILYIYRDDKRCLHDIISSTKVIDLSIKVEPSVQENPNSFIA